MIVLSLLATLSAQAGKKIELAYKSHPDEPVSWQIDSEGQGTMRMRMGVMDEEMAMPMALDVDLQIVDQAGSSPDRLVRRIGLREIELRMPDASGGTRTSRMTAEGMWVDGEPAPASAMRPFIFGEALATARFSSTGRELELDYQVPLPPSMDLARIATLPLPVLPERKVKPGKRWTGTRSLPVSLDLGVPLEPELTYTLASVDGDVATLTVKGELVIPEGQQVTAQNNMIVVVEELRYTIEGTLHFDHARGVLVDARMQIGTQFTGHVPDGSLHMSMTLPMNYVITTQR